MLVGSLVPVFTRVRSNFRCVRIYLLTPLFVTSKGCMMVRGLCTYDSAGGLLGFRYATDYP